MRATSLLQGIADPVRGIRAMVVGTGGGPFEGPFSTTPSATSEVRIGQRWGVLKLELREASYRWWFIATDGSVLDSGSTACH